MGQDSSPPQRLEAPMHTIPPTHVSYQLPQGADRMDAWRQTRLWCMGVVPTIIFRRMLWKLSAQPFTIGHSSERPFRGAPSVIEPITDARSGEALVRRAADGVVRHQWRSAAVPQG